MTARGWLWLGLGLGLCLAALALLGDPDTIGRAVTAVGLDRLTPYAQPPLGQTARAALALGLTGLGLMLGWGLGRVAGRTPVVEEPTETSAAPLAQSPDATSLDSLGWRTPTGSAIAPDKPGMARSQSGSALEGSLLAPVIVPQADVREVEAAQEVRATGTQPLVLAHAAPHHPIKDDSMPDNSPALARIEAMIDDLARHGPQGFDARFEAIDARLAQMAQQLAELSSLARAQQRTPAMTPALMRAPQPPADPAQRRALAQAARDLRAQLGNAGFA